MDLVRVHLHHLLPIVSAFYLASSLMRGFVFNEACKKDCRVFSGGGIACFSERLEKLQQRITIAHLEYLVAAH